MHKEISIAFQGGGARLIGLVAAAHALSDMERGGDIIIRAISGSSAGSIAAFLLASNANFDSVRDAIRQLEPRIKRNFPAISNRALFLRFLSFLVTGRTIYKADHLKEIVKTILSRVGINQGDRISDLSLNKDMFLMYSDINSLSSVPASGDEKICDAIVRSCLLPLIFSSHRSDHGGLHVDGGILDNLPTEILMQSPSHNNPIFAIGFNPEQRAYPSSPWSYLFTLATSGVHSRVIASKRAIGEDMVLELDTTLTTLDFDKIVSVGIEGEYAQIRDQTRRFFERYLSGVGEYSDPFAKTRGSAPVRKLKSMERQLYHYVYESLARASCSNSYLKTRVNAFSLDSPKLYDEIIVEQLINFSENDYLKGVILPLTNGSGYTVDVECYAHLGGPEGASIPFEQFLINDRDSEIAKMGGTANLVVLLFKGDIRRLIGRSIYILKKEKRFGFTRELATNKADFLSVRSFYWPTQEIGLTLNVPKRLPLLRCDWQQEGGRAISPIEPIQLVQNLVPVGYRGYATSIRGTELGTRLRGDFYVDGEDEV